MVANPLTANSQRMRLSDYQRVSKLQKGKGGSARMRREAIQPLMKSYRNQVPGADVEGKDAARAKRAYAKGTHSERYCTKIVSAKI